MEDWVIDSSVAVKWFVLEADSATAIKILESYKRNEINFLAPDLIYAEFGNIIWKKQVFQGFASADADFALREIQKLAISLTPATDLFDDAYQIAVKHSRTFYDSLYLALSVRENCKFVTADEKFYNAVRADFPKMILLADWQ
jgi:predicted nucleic acid-binding protein